MCFRVTKEHRENLIKGTKSLFVKCKDNIKETQNKYIKILKDNDSLSIDLVHSLQDQVLRINFLLYRNYIWKIYFLITFKLFIYCNLFVWLLLKECHTFYAPLCFFSSNTITNLREDNF